MREQSHDGSMYPGSIMTDPSVSRRNLLKAAAGACAAAVFAPMINVGRFQLFAHSTTEYSKRAIKLVLGGNFRRVLSDIWTVPAQPAAAASHNLL